MTGTFDYKAAREAGYTDEEIAIELSHTSDFDIQGALDSGYKIDEIISELSASTEKPSEEEPSSFERKAAQLSVDIPAAVRATPRVALEAPGFFADVADIAAEKLQQPLDRSRAEGDEGESFFQKLFPRPYPGTERKTDEELFKPGSAIRNLIPESIQDKYQQLKEAKVGETPLFPGMEESRKEVTEQLTNPDSFIRKTLPELFGEEPLEFKKSAAEIEDLLTPKDKWEEYQRRAIEFGVPASGLGAGSSTAAVTGAGLGLGDKYLEDQGVSEDDRKLISVLFAPFFHEAIEGAAESLTAKSGQKAGPGGPAGPEGPGGGGPGGGIPPTAFYDDIISSIKSKEIASPTDLSVKLLSPRMKNVNVQQLKIAAEEGINPTLASVTEGGLLQFGANTLSQNFITKGIFDEAAERMTGDIQTAIERKVSGISPKEFLDLSEVTQEDIGTAPFENPVKTLADSFSNDNLSVYETGESVKTRLNEIKDIQRETSTSLYDKVKKDPRIQTKFTPIESQLETKNLLSKKKTKGLASDQKKDLISKLSTLDKFFNKEEVVKPKEGVVAELILPEALKKEIAAKKGQKVKKPRELTFEEAISQVEDLGALIDFDESIGNQSKALIPIRRALIRDIETGMQSKGLGDLLSGWNDAKEFYADYAKTFGRDNPSVFKAQFTNKPESIVSSALRRSELEGFLKAFSRSGESESAYFNLQKKAVQEIVGPKAILAEKLSEFKITPEKVNKLNEIKPVLQMDAQVLVGDIEGMSAKVRKRITNELRRDAIRADVLNSLAKGELPINTLKLMNNLKGINLVSDALSSTPKGKGFLQALKQQKARELIFNNAVDNNGNVRLTKINTNLMNSANRLKMKELMGKKLYSELQDIARFTEKAIEGDKAFRNLSQTETVRQNLVLLNRIYSMARTLVFGGGTSLVTGYLMPLAGFAGMYSLSKLYSSPKFMKALSDTTLKAAKLKKTKANAAKYNKSVEGLLDVVRQELTEKEFSEVEKLNH